jgi:hypothetical protein
MKTATGLILIAVGAIFAFAVHGHPWFLNLQVIGWIIMVVGAIGIAIPMRGYGWVRRQVVTRRGPDGQPVTSIRQKRYPPYIMINPAAEPDVEVQEAVAPEMPTNSEAKSWTNSDTLVTGKPVASADAAVADEETVEEFFRE